MREMGLPMRIVAITWSVRFGLVTNAVDGACNSLMSLTLSYTLFHMRGTDGKI